MKLFPPFSIFHLKYNSYSPSSGPYHESQVAEKDPPPSFFLCHSTLSCVCDMPLPGQPAKATTPDGLAGLSQDLHSQNVIERKKSCPM